MLLKRLTLKGSEGPAATPQQRAHPHRQRGHHAQVGHGHVHRVHVRLMVVTVGAQVDPDHQGVGGQTHQEEEDVEHGEAAEEAGVSSASRTQQCLHLGQAGVVSSCQV